nr:hypothetical protein [Sulfurimonas sp. MAG313]
MIKLIFTALGLGLFFKAHSNELSVMPLYNKTLPGEYRRDFL